MLNDYGIPAWAGMTFSEGTRFIGPLRCATETRSQGAVRRAVSWDQSRALQHRLQSRKCGFLCRNFQE